MGIIFKLYSYFWILILFLYSLNISEFSQPLNGSLLFFLIFTIIVSFIIGYYLKPYKFKIHRNPKYNTAMVTGILLIGFILNFIYAGYIPFFNLMIGNYSYIKFEGIPTLFPFLYTFSLYYYYCLIYYYFYTKKRKYLIQGSSLIIIFILFFSRSLLVFAILGTVLIKILINRKRQNLHLNLKSLCMIFIIVIIVCYFFGILGNIRTGVSWNDCSYIERLGMFNNYPSWLPKQFMWIYAYLISPLANLNYNVINNNYHLNVMNLTVCFIPEFISKRWLSQYIISSDLHTLLIRSYFNAQTVYVNFYYSYGIVGCYLCYFILVIIICFMNYVCKKKKIYNPVLMVILSIFVTMTFFYNVFYYTLTSLLLIWAIISIFLTGKRYKIKIK